MSLKSVTSKQEDPLVLFVCIYKQYKSSGFVSVLLTSFRLMDSGKVTVLEDVETSETPTKITPFINSS